MLLENKRVFYVEDDIMNLAVVRAILERHGAKVYSDVWGTNTILQLTMLGKVDVILLDLMLKRSNYSGYAIFKQIRAMPDLKAIPIVLITAADPDIEQVEAEKLGLNGFIAKPIDRRVFPKQVASVIAGEKVWDLGTLHTRL